MLIRTIAFEFLLNAFVAGYVFFESSVNNSNCWRRISISVLLFILYLSFHIIFCLHFLICLYFAFLMFLS
nr:MAG TPA: hypothetical protein [Bacteriophage sp.]DAM48144.1 MAG TPA: hypothetical protein [Caudoviricetes sp.]